MVILLSLAGKAFFGKVAFKKRLISTNRVQEALGSALTSSEVETVDKFCARLQSYFARLPNISSLHPAYYSAANGYGTDSVQPQTSW